MTKIYSKCPSRPDDDPLTLMTIHEENKLKRRLSQRWRLFWILVFVKIGSTFLSHVPGGRARLRSHVERIATCQGQFCLLLERNSRHSRIKRHYTNQNKWNRWENNYTDDDWLSKEWKALRRGIINALGNLADFRLMNQQPVSRSSALGRGTRQGDFPSREGRAFF